MKIIAFFLVLQTPIAIGNSILLTPKTIQNTEYSSEDLSDFIYNRTFCIAGNNNGSGYASTAGTGWLFKKDSGDYQYEMFTNWHVSIGMEKQVAYSYADNTNGSSISSFNLLTDDADWHEGSYFKNNDGEQLGVDVAIMTVDFSNWVSSDANLETRLNNLNEYASSHDSYLFNGVVDFNNLPISSNYYVGGYPWHDASGTSFSGNKAQWWCSSDYISSKTICFSSKNENHVIDDEEKIISIGNHYDSVTINTNNEPMSKMGSGCSGSMIIDSNENLIGLLWGGGGNGTYSIHSYETFSWDNGSHNLYNDYINGEWISKEVTTSHTTIIFLATTFSLIAVAVSVGLIIGNYIKKKNNKKKL